MDPHAFLQLILPASGWYVALARKNGQVVHQRSVQTLDALLQLVALWDREGCDCYHACSSFEHERIWNESEQRWQRRTHENVWLVACLWLDIDTRLSKSDARYADHAEAWYAVQAFCGAARLPSPVFVNSGGGLHCYWPLDFELELGQWEALANALKRATVVHDLAADHVRTADASSVLRTPSTHHWKSGRIVEHGPLIDYYDINLFKHLEHEYGPTDERSRPGRPGVAVTPFRGPQFGLLGRMHGTEYCDPRAIGRSCRQIANIESDPGRVPEPVHYAAAGVFETLGDAGRSYFLEIERRYPGHRDDWVHNALRRQSGFNGVTCAHFAGINPAGCQGCPHKGHVTSPCYFARQFQGPPPQGPGNGGGLPGGGPSGAPQAGPTAQVYAVPDHHVEILPPLPKDHKGGESWQWRRTSVGVNQLVQALQTNQGQLDDQIVSDYPIYLEGIFRGEIVAQQHVYVFQQYLPKHGWFPIVVRAGDLYNGHGIPALMDGGAAIRDPKLFLGYVRDATRDWNAVNTMSFRFEQCGWKERNQAFLVGEQLYRHGEMTIGMVSPEIKPLCQYLGPDDNADVREWFAAANKLWRPDFHAAHFALYTSFGAVLLNLLDPGVGGAIVHFHHPKSGVGKTWALKGACSVWGTWRGLAVEAHDTMVARGHMLAHLSNLPVIMDEMSMMFRAEIPEIIRDFVMMFSLGQDRKRGEQTGKGLRYAAGRWCTFILAASNEPIADILETFARGTDAAARRVLELSWPDLEFDHSQGAMLEHTMMEHAGAAGAAFLEHLLNPQVMGLTLSTLRDVHRRFSRLFLREDRLRINVLACAYTAGILLQQIGLTHADPIAVVDWAAQQLVVEQKPQVPPTPHGDVLKTLGIYLADHQDAVLRLAFAYAPGQRPVEVLNPPRRLLMRYELGTQRLFVSTHHLKEWLIKRGRSWRDTTTELKAAKVLVGEVTRRLGAGTLLASAPQPVLEIDMAHPLMGVVAEPLKAANDGQ